MLRSMRVIGRVLLGTLAIVFAMAFLARLVSRLEGAVATCTRRFRRARRSRRRRTRIATCAPQPALPRCRGAVAGDGWWCRLRRARARCGATAGARCSVMTGYRLRRTRFSSRPVTRLQKSVSAMTYAMRESSAPPQHAANEGFVRDGGLPRRLRAGASRRARRARPGCDFPAAGGVAAPSARRQAFAARRA